MRSFILLSFLIITSFTVEAQRRSDDPIRGRGDGDLDTVEGMLIHIEEGTRAAERAGSAHHCPTDKCHSRYNGRDYAVCEGMDSVCIYPERSNDSMNGFRARCSREVKALCPSIKNECEPQRPPATVPAERASSRPGRAAQPPSPTGEPAESRPTPRPNGSRGSNFFQ